MSDETKKQDLAEIIQNAPDHTSVEFFSTPKYVGIAFRFSRPDWGTGGFTLSHRLSDRTWHLDDECSSRERVIEYIREAVPLLVDTLYRKDNVKVEVTDDA